MKFLNSILILSTVAINAVRGDVKYFNKCIHDGDFAITFDDGPDLSHTEMVLDVLDEFNVKATFFVNGKNCVDITSNPTAQKLIKREFNSGHVIGSHTFSHPSGITQLSDEQLTNELTNLNNALYDIIGVKPNFFRPPLGEYSEDNLKVIEQCGIKANILWNLDSEDWDSRYNATQQYVDNLSGKSPSSHSFISLNHDIQKVTAEYNLRIVIPYIRNLGYHLVTMDECTGIPPYQDGKDYSKDRSNDNSGKSDTKKEPVTAPTPVKTPDPTPTPSPDSSKNPIDNIVTDNPENNLTGNNTNSNPTENNPTNPGNTTDQVPDIDSSSDAFMVKTSFIMSSALFAVLTYLFL